jgi:tellurite resistance protein TehA-like permease
MHSFKNIFKYYLLPENSKKLLRYICFLLSVMCVPVYVFLMLHNFPEDMAKEDYRGQILSLFLGLWTINLMCIANYLKD